MIKNPIYSGIFILLLISSSQQSSAQDWINPFLDKGYLRIDSTDAVITLRQEYSYVVGFNLKQVAFESIQALDSSKTAEKSLYLDGVLSPEFRRIDYLDLIDQYPDSYLLNASYFEQYEKSTPLSYPIFDQGKWITGGSSPFGPVKNPYNEYYSSIELLALAIDTHSARIEPFQQNQKPNSFVLVSQKWSDHPAKVIANNRKTRFLLLTTVDEDGDNKNEWLLFSMGFGTIDQLALPLEELSENQQVMTLDGGSSVFFYHPQFGTQHRPMNMVSKNDEDQSSRLPHYLRFVIK